MTVTSERVSGELARIGEEAFMFGFPLVLMEATRRLSSSVPPGVRPGFGPMNAFHHMRAFPPGDFREVVRPNFDTLYSLMWWDVSDEPLVISVPDTGGRYYMLPFLDMWTDVFALVGSRTTGTAAGHVALTASGWDGELPDGVERIEAPTPVGWVVGRIRTDGAADYEAVHRVQDGFRATPLSAWPGEAPMAAPTSPGVDYRDPLAHVLGLSGTELLRQVVELANRYGVHAIDQPVLARLRRLGVRIGEPLDVDGLDAGQRAAIEAGADAARRRMREIEPRLFPKVNGWSQPTYLLGSYGTAYLHRAAVAQSGLGANLVEDAVYPVLFEDQDGRTPSGDEDQVLRFAAGELPPADAFWSVTMYDAEGYPVPNELDRYALGDRDPLAYGDDGSLEIYVQHDDPGPDRRSNWLPAPRGPIGLTLRLYDPRPEVLDGRWSPPPLERA